MHHIKITRAVAVSAIAFLALTGCAATGGDTADVADDCAPVHPDVATITPGVLTTSVFVTPPYTAEDSTGGYLGGTEGAILSKIAEMECLTIDASSLAVPAMWASIESGRADVAIAGNYYTDERAAKYNLSSAMYRDGMNVVSTAGYDSVEDLEGKKTGVIQGYLWNEDLVATLGTDNVIQYQDPTSMMSDLEAGRIDAAITTSAEAAYRISLSDADLKAPLFTADERVKASTEPGRVVIGITKGNSSLTDAIDADIQTLIEDGTIAEILEANGIDGSLAGDQ
ncbi:ABC transporter substrate-binding protein [Microbacterium sp. cx-59]|uniref:substrate-binding periplasmic protein n=1 Tax=Microbacterium sp. cx-59 TaxID=2891207 RepID=UPI001E4A99F1|nr:ABC transporter substrate-binding protein [Microbacterium sp. cx-59]MCC4908897.1 transporter substrate-binding domain-containing protein [Microbacterium sp. cx-59]